MFSGLLPKADFPIPFANSSRNAAIAASRVGSKRCSASGPVYVSPASPRIARSAARPLSVSA
jgi:hypothetical protein